MSAITGKELLFQTLRHQEPARLPWVPFAGVHAGKLMGYTATEVLTDADKLLASLRKVKELYRPDGQPVLFDLQVEAEILGCELVWAEKAPASVKTHPLQNTKEIPTKIITKEDGRMPLILKTMEVYKAEVGDEIALYGLICGPFTLASHLRGSDIFTDMYDDPDYVTALLDYTTNVAIAMARYYIEAGMDIIAAVDPLVSQISPKTFKQFLTDPFTRLFDEIRSHNVFSSFFVCGNATRNLDVMCQTNPDSISVDENIDMTAAQGVTKKYNVTLGGNIPLTTLMLHGTQQDNMKYVINLMDTLEHKNLIIAPGCDMPYDVPAENGSAVQQAVTDPAGTRKILENYTAADLNIPIDLPDYENLPRPLIEVFTLDSATCAACTYMMAAAYEAKDEYGDRIDVVEYKMMFMETVARMMKLGVKNLPSIYINGQLKYSSIIPSRKELQEEIEKVL